MESWSTNSEYPRNLIAAMKAHWEKYSIPVKGFDDAMQLPMKKLIPAVEYLLCTMSERDVDIIHYRYMYGMTKAETGRTLGISGARIGDLERRIFWRLKQPSMIKFLMYGVEGVITNEVQKLKEEVAETVARKKEESDIGLEAILCRDIETMDLSVRSFNCLKSARYHGIHTIGDVVDLFQSGGIRNIRNLGTKSIEEIHFTLMSMGVPEIMLKEEEDN